LFAIRSKTIGSGRYFDAKVLRDCLFFVSRCGSDLLPLDLCSKKIAVLACRQGQKTAPTLFTPRLPVKMSFQKAVYRIAAKDM